jgi:protease IV
MAINADTLLDRLYLKSQITKWRICAIVLAFVAIIAVTERFPNHSPIEREFVARLSMEGIIGDDQRVYDLIDDLAENNKAKAVIVWLDTPGGSAVGGEEIYERLIALGKRKPVVAVMRSVAASAGYMIAISTDYVVAREGTITGSIGVLIEGAEVTELAKKLGIEPLIVKSAPLKGTPSPFEKMTPESEQVVRSVIMDFYERFVDMVAERRKLPRDRVIQLADGRVYSGKAALTNKLVDALGGEDVAMEWLVKQRHIKDGLEIKDVKLEEEHNWMEAISQSIAGKFLPNNRIGLDGVKAVWHPELH